VPASVVDGVLLADAYLWLECELDRIIDGFGVNCLIAGRIVAARIDPRAMRSTDEDDPDVVARAPLLTYLAPGRYLAVDRSLSFPFHAGFKR
jgi:flavin reductase (DIM6/NTAB) family NADH-FMN oxidoreductase RutF